LHAQESAAWLMRGVTCDRPRVLQGNTEAWFHLGVMHLNGWGVPRNVMQAQYFFSMTAKTVRHPG
jgi:TPR repeat protein